MNLNVGIQNSGLVVWDGTTATPRDIRRHVNFGFTFEVVTDLAAETTFLVKAHDPDAADPCVAGPARDVPEIPLCQEPATPAPTSTIVLPAGTLAGSICAATIPCRPGAFVSLAAGTGDTANVKATVILQGPMV